MENEGKPPVVRKFPFELNLTDPLAQNLVPLTPLAKCWRPRRSRFNGSSRSSSICGNFAVDIHFEKPEWLWDSRTLFLRYLEHFLPYKATSTSCRKYCTLIPPVMSSSCNKSYFSSCVFVEVRTRNHLQNDHFSAHLVSLGHLTVHNVVVRVEDKVDYALEINESDDATAGVGVQLQPNVRLRQEAVGGGRHQGHDEGEGREGEGRLARPLAHSAHE